MNCNEINQTAAELKMKFDAGEILKADDMDLLIDLTLAARDCSGEVSTIDSSYYKQPLDTITDLTNLNYLLLVDQQRHYVKETNIEYIWQATATEGDYEPFDKGLNTQGFWKRMAYTLFSESLENRLLDSVYENLSQSITVFPTSFEKGVETDLVFTWRVTKNDDTLNTVTVDGQDKLNEATGVNRTYTVNNQVNTKAVSLATNLTRNTVTGSTFTLTNSATSTARIPQYFGLVADGDVPPLTYALLNPTDTTKLKKFVSSSNVKTVVLGTDLPTPSNEKLFFLSTNSNAVIRDGNNFVVTSAFTKSTVTMELDNGTQSITQYLLIDPVNSAGTYTITNS